MSKSLDEVFCVLFHKFFIIAISYTPVFFYNQG